MSSRSEHFECHWRGSPRLALLYVGVCALALLSLIGRSLPWYLRLLLALACLAHAAWVLPRRILLSHPAAWTGLRRTADGWALLNARDGWQPVQLRPDSLALPLVVVLRFRRPGRRWSEGLCIPFDSLPAEAHRQLRVRLRFSRRRWAVPG